jgi:muramoyltetrapeptide carboxypeptidase
MLKPRPLRSGDRLAIVAPASPFNVQEFEAGLAEVRALGFEPSYDDSIFQRLGYVAGSAALRASAFVRAWQDPLIAGLIAVRGGYGSVQTLPHLDRALLQRTPKVFIGYSDLTSVLTYLTLHCGITSFHGPTLTGRLDRGEQAYDRDSLLRAVGDVIPLGEVSSEGMLAVRPGEAAGMLVGGTLTQIAASLGTPYAFSPPVGAVVFLEDVGERPYRLDRMLTQLALAGVFARASGIVFGEMPGCDEPGGGLTARSVIADLLRDFPGPVIVGLPSGHTASPARTLPFGVKARVIAAPTPMLVVEEAAVKN